MSNQTATDRTTELEALVLRLRYTISSQADQIASQAAELNTLRARCAKTDRRHPAGATVWGDVTDDGHGFQNPNDVR
jgi:hypothetical protein